MNYINRKNESDPFTRTPGVAGKAFIDTHYADLIIRAFEDKESAKYIYKIVGIRGSGKSVEFGKIIEYFKTKDEWLVFTPSAAGNPVQTLIADLSRQKFIDANRHQKTAGGSLSISGDTSFLNGGASFNYAKSTQPDDRFYSAESELREMIDKANKKGYRILIGIDDIAKTPEMVEFLSIYGTMIIAGADVRLICTGLSQNIEDFSNEKHLTFFRRGDSIVTESLSLIDIAYMYQKLLNTNQAQSAELARFVNGYAYAYQVLGSLFFNKKDEETLNDLIPEFEHTLFRDSYMLIWKSLTAGEQEFVKAVLNTPTGEVKEIRKKLPNEKSYSTMRSRLIDKHLLDTERGLIRIPLPRFKEFVEIWGE